MIDLWTNGTIYTGRGQFAEAFAVQDGCFLAAGTLSHVRDICQANGEEIQEHDLGGRFVCPGFNDSHMHLLSLGKSLVEVHLAEHTASKKDMISHLKKSLAARSDLFSRAESGEVPPDPGHPAAPIKWFCGRGWNQESFQDDHFLPSRYDLDRVSTEIPIYLARACGHMAVVNSKAIQLMGLSADTPQSADASFDVDKHGEPTGILRENALQWATSQIPAPTKEELKHMLEKAGQLVNRYGITSVQSDDFDMWPEVSFETILTCFQELISENRLHVRVNEQCLLPTQEKLDAFLHAGYRTGGTLPADFGDPVQNPHAAHIPTIDADPALTDTDIPSIPADRFRIGPLKLLLDGSLGANTAYLQNDYADAPGEKGMPLYTQEELDRIVLTAHKHGMQIAMHAIGDGAVQMGIDAYRRAGEIYPRDDARHGIVHCQLTTARQLGEFRELGLHAYIQSIFLDADAPIVTKRVSPELAATSYQAATYLEKEISLSNGSDAPVELPDVMAGIQCAVTRRSLHTPMTDPYLPDEALSVAQAIDSFTTGGAHASFEEDIKGRIQPGMLADFAVLEQDPFQTAAESLAQIQVYATVLGGQIVYAH